MLTVTARCDLCATTHSHINIPLPSTLTENQNLRSRTKWRTGRGSYSRTKADMSQHRFKYTARSRSPSSSRSPDFDARYRQRSPFQRERHESPTTVTYPDFYPPLYKTSDVRCRTCGALGKSIRDHWKTTVTDLLKVMKPGTV